jgi:hypothetical protein
MDRIGLQNIGGRVRAHRVENEIWTPRTALESNLVLYQWANIVSKLLNTGDARYRIGGMYLEFENVASPGDTVSPDTFTRARTVEYYDDLAGSTTRDYLRVPITASQTLSEGEGLTNNQLVFFARSSGLAGVHGKPFATASNSVIFGASLVAFIDATDATQDLLFSSFYFNVADQQQKLNTSQVGIEWELTLQ